MPDRNPGDAILRLSERLEQEAAKVGLTLRQFAFIPNADGPHSVQALFTTDGEPPTDDEQARFDAQFEEMMRSQAVAERDEKIRRAKDQLASGGGILEMLEDEDDDDPDA
jgi:hypothetical protein